MQVKLPLVNIYLNGGLHAVYIGKPSNFLMVSFLNNKSEPNFVFLHIPRTATFIYKLQHCSMLFLVSV